MDPTPFASFLFVMSKRSACMYPACPMGDRRSTPAASMRSAHPILSKIASRRERQPARKTGFGVLVQPISSSHPDGRIYGFRALVADVRVVDYVRVKPVATHG
ncbi:hypothetical protein, partial [Burkholderia ubonensis]|uniref:hypothetical protein n=1 Tax=Burkholderia ubonensis TaxID=101571 RepID=UPI001E4F2FB9